MKAVELLGDTISVPEVVIGRGKIAYPVATPIISIPCPTDKGPLHIDVALKEVSSLIIFIGTNS